MFTEGRAKLGLRVVSALICASVLALSACLGPSSTQPRAEPIASQTPAPVRVVEAIAVWSGVAPSSETWTQKEITQQLGGGNPPNLIIRNVVHPTLTAYLPDPAKATGAAVIVAPGGGFMMLSINSEGHDVAKWLAERGVAAFVLKYRLIETPPDDAEFIAKLTSFLANQPADTQDRANSLAQRALLGAADAMQALRVVRSHAAEWGYSADRVGLMGFSAGGFITAHVAMQPDVSARPNFAAPIYGGTIDPKVGVPKDLPPFFVMVAADDPIVGDSTVDLFNQLRAAGHKPAFHHFASGGHGFGLNKQGKAVDSWIDAFYHWMNDQGFLKREQ